jgi:hypothetical protein
MFLLADSSESKPVTKEDNFVHLKLTKEECFFLKNCPEDLDVMLFLSRIAEKAGFNNRELDLESATLYLLDGEVVVEKIPQWEFCEGPQISRQEFEAKTGLKIPLSKKLNAEGELVPK